ncbi:MAG TPA: S8 family serine peptidase, partial [bacterium]|nr:S8 family serine peptidase [bacterium]
LPIRSCGTSQLACNVVDEARGIDMAIANGADIINLSLGGYSASNTEREAVNRALAADILVVAAVGNFRKLGKFGGEDGDADIFYPAGYTDVLGVGSIDPVPNPEILAQVRRSDFTNWGDMTDVVAVGKDVITTAPSAQVPAPIFNCTPGQPQTCYYEQKVGQISGTSFAAPLVSGLAALLKAQFPDFGRRELYNTIVQTARDLGDQDSTGRNDEFGYGLVDFFNALSGQGGAIDDVFVVSMATNPIITNQVYVVVKVRQTLVGNPNLQLTIRQPGQPVKNIDLSPSPLESDPTVRFARILVNDKATIEATVSGTLPNNETRQLSVSYIKEQ